MAVEYQEWCCLGERRHGFLNFFCVFFFLVIFRPLLGNSFGLLNSTFWDTFSPGPIFSSIVLLLLIFLRKWDTYFWNEDVPTHAKKACFWHFSTPRPPKSHKNDFFHFFCVFPVAFLSLVHPPPPRGLGFPFFSLWRHHNAGRSTWDEWRFSLVRTTLWLWGRFANGKTGHWTGSFF